MNSATTGGSPDDPRATAETKIAVVTARYAETHPNDSAPTRLPVAVGEYYPPSGRRQLGAVIVRHCPSCGHCHLHRTTGARAADGAVRTGSCGAAYKIRLRIPAPRLGGVA